MKCSESVVQFTMAHTIRSSTRIKGLMSIITNFFVKKPVMLANRPIRQDYLDEMVCKHVVQLLENPRFQSNKAEEGGSRNGDKPY